MPKYFKAKLAYTEARLDRRPKNFNLKAQGDFVKLNFRGLEQSKQSSKTVYGPGIIKKTKSEATMACIVHYIYKYRTVTGRDTDSGYGALTATLWLEQVENGHKKSGSM